MTKKNWSGGHPAGGQIDLIGLATKYNTGLTRPAVVHMNLVSRIWCLVHITKVDRLARF